MGKRNFSDAQPKIMDDPLHRQISVSLHKVNSAHEISNN